MSDKNLKQLRGQIRQIVQEMLPTILAQELTAAIQKQLVEEVNRQMTNIGAEARVTLQHIDARQKDFQGYLHRTLEALKPAPTPSDDNTRDILPDLAPTADSL